MAENPLKSLIPKDTQGEGMGKELSEKANQVSNARRAINPASEAPKAAPIGAPAHMTPAQGPFGSQPGEKRIDVTSYQKPLGQMHKGGTVPKTGPYVLKKDEKVLTGDQHGQLKSALSLASSALSHDADEPQEPKKEIKAMHIRKASDGSHVIEHHHVHFSHPMEEHTAKNMDELHDHLEQHWGAPNDGEQESENDTDGSPAVAAMQKDLGFKK